MAWPFSVVSPALVLWLGVPLYMLAWWCFLNCRATLTIRGTSTTLLAIILSATPLFVGSYCRSTLGELTCSLSPFPREGIVLSTAGELYAAPQIASQKIAKLNNGEAVIIIAKQTPWLQLELRGGRRGWSKQETIGVTP